MTNQERKPQAPKPVYYYCDERIPAYIENLLQIPEEKAALERRGAALDMKTVKDIDYDQVALEVAEDSLAHYKKINALRQAKKRLLDELIFPSMANIVCFLDLTARHDIIADDFDDAISDLLGVSVDMKLPFTKYGDEVARPMAFAHLVEAVLRPKHPTEEQIDFRIALTNILMGLIWSKLERAMPKNFKSELMELMKQDFQRVRIWTRLCASESEEKFDATADRAIFIPKRDA